MAVCRLLLLFDGASEALIKNYLNWVICQVWSLKLFDGRTGDSFERL
ncbi:hypothetical protein OK016_08090 [Vibrio chagasii]|nr:hypothetical protein [Vibrio chagasii]